jgi:hypothetical protein
VDERFRFPPDILRSAASRTRRRLLGSAAATAGLVVALWAMVLRPRGGGPGALAFALVLLAFLVLASLRRRLRRLHARWSSVEIALRDDGIARTVDGFATIAIARAEVSGVEERPAGLVVRGAGGVALLVPREVEGYERARALLAGWVRPS